MIRWLAVAAALMLAAVFALPAVAGAATVVPAGKTVVEITVIGQDVVLNGTSAGSVIVIDGDLTLGPHGKAGHGVTVIGGKLTTAPGSQIHGDVFQLAGPLPSLSPWLFAAGVAALVLARCLVVWLLVRVARILVGWPTSTTMLAASRRRPLRSALVGALITAGVLAAAILLTLTVVGVIFAAALAGVLLLAGALGVAFALSGLEHREEHHRTVFILLVIPLIGDALLALATVVAMGAAFHYLVDERGARSRALTTP